jgi:hypothetical protein
MKSYHNIGISTESNKRKQLQRKANEWAWHKSFKPKKKKKKKKKTYGQ